MGAADLPDRRVIVPWSFDGRFLRDGTGRALLMVTSVTEALVYLGPEEPRAFLQALVEVVNRGEK